MQRKTLLGAVASFAASAGLALSCSSFSGTDSTAANGDAATEPEAGDAAARAEGGDAGAQDPCATDAGALTGKFLWVVGGFDPGNNQPLDTIFRAARHCDGSLEPFVKVSTTIPDATVRGAGALLGETVLLVGGVTAKGAKDGLVQYARFDTAGELGSFASSFNPLAATFRPVFAADSSRLAVAGGSDDAGMSASVWSLDSGTPTVKSLPILLSPAANSAAALQGDTFTVVAQGSDGGSSLLQLSLSSTEDGWQNVGGLPGLFDCGSASTAKAMFILSGYLANKATPRDVTVIPLTNGNAGTPTVIANVLPADAYLPGVTIERGFLYVVSGSTVSYGELNSAGDGLKSSDPFKVGPTLPTRDAPLIFIH